MINLDFEIPEPSKFNSFNDIDAVALQVGKSYRNSSNNKDGVPINGEKFLDWLDISIEWDEIIEPEGVKFFAGLSPNKENTVCINQKHSDFFNERPDVFQQCLGHECGHYILKHLNHSSINQDLPLFPQKEEKEFMLHSSSWYEYGMTSEEVKSRQGYMNNLQSKLLKDSLKNPESYLELKQMNDKFEPLWMFLQAEHFAKCICIPKDRLFEMLEEIPLFEHWTPIYNLAERFGVSASIMTSRLKQLKLIEIKNNQVILVSNNTQRNLI